jgi:hypothetical protein
MENRFNALGTQIVHGHKIQAVPVERVEYFAQEGQVFVQATKLFQDLKPFYENRDANLNGDYRNDFAVLAEAGFGWIVVGYRKGAEKMPQGIVDALNTLCGPYVARGPGIAVWKFPEFQYTDDELVLWKQQHELMMQALQLKKPMMGPPK